MKRWKPAAYLLYITKCCGDFLGAKVGSIDGVCINCKREVRVMDK